MEKLIYNELINPILCNMPKSLSEQQILRLKELYNYKGFKFFDGNKPYNLNIIGWRLSKEIDLFNDIFTIIYRDKALNWKCLKVTGTTKPGRYYFLKPMNKAGTGIVVPGQYRGVWEKGLHKGLDALIQKEPIIVYRDNNKDLVIDMDNTQTGMFNIDFHRMYKATISTVVGNRSAGCQGPNTASGFWQVMDLVDESLDLYPNSFTYTLFDAISQ